MTLPEPTTVRPLADWILKNGSGIAFIAIALLLLFVYFIKLIFKKTDQEKLEEILRLSIEIKIKIEQLLGKEIEK